MYGIALARFMDAFEEYDKLGAEAFLRKYGYSDAKKWVVVRRGHEYPARAIVAAAYEKAMGHPLLSKDFPPFFSEGDYAAIFRRLGLDIQRKSGS